MNNLERCPKCGNKLERKNKKNVLVYKCECGYNDVKFKGE